jgi:hypothetical protein
MREGAAVTFVGATEEFAELVRGEECGNVAQLDYNIGDSETNSEKHKTHFDENASDLRILKHESGSNGSNTH